ncbi:hypothetical protein R1flu_021172 [Riccia fluitans]|uniref:Uncharacterized protein n=1 Tax=Riccia fluitans TaxID=41844 RepID=A0ABD1ZS92_9MARC
MRHRSFRWKSPTAVNGRKLERREDSLEMVGRGRHITRKAGKIGCIEWVVGNRSEENVSDRGGRVCISSPRSRGLYIVQGERGDLSSLTAGDRKEESEEAQNQVGGRKLVLSCVVQKAQRGLESEWSLIRMMMLVAVGSASASSSRTKTPGLLSEHTDSFFKNGETSRRGCS